MNAFFLAFIFCCCTGLSVLYIGPYEVSFNSSAHPVYLISLEPSYDLFKNKNNQWEATSTYVGVSNFNNSTTRITITEGALTNTLLNNLTSLTPSKGFTKLQQLDRVIDGKDAMVAKYKNTKGGWLAQMAVVALPVQFKYYDYSSDNMAVLQIYGDNYTDYEFDRLLDTFRVSRLISR